jgi:PAS domain S-box-containing protein
MDWEALTALLAERSHRPLLLLDGAQRIRLFTSALESTLGWRRYEVEGQLWEVCAPAEHAPTTRRWFNEAMRGALRRFECAAMTRDGRRVLLDAEMSLVGKGRDQGLLLTIQGVRDEGVTAGQLEESEYEILVTTMEFGRLVNASATTERGRPCFAVFHDLSAPCADCPIIHQAGDQTWPRTVVRRNGKAFEIVNASAVDDSRVHVTIRTINEKALSAIHEAKIEALADKAALSERERVVLRYLFMGRTIDDIASILELGRSTVKFHQANILQKLGADSRLDLMRLI